MSDKLMPWEEGYVIQEQPSQKLMPWEEGYVIQEPKVDKGKPTPTMTTEEYKEYLGTTLLPQSERDELLNKRLMQDRQAKDMQDLPMAEFGDKLLPKMTEEELSELSQPEPGLVDPLAVAGETAKGAVGGISKFPFFVGAMGEKAVNYFTEGELDLFEQAMKDNQAMIEAGGPGADVGDIIGQVLGVGTAAGNYFKHIITGSIVGGIVAGGETYASGETAEEALKTGGLVSTLMLGIPMTFGAAAGIIRHIEGAVGPLSYGALLMLKNNKHGISKEEAIELLKGVDKEDQTLVLSRMDQAATGLIKAATADNIPAQKNFEHMLLQNRKDLYEAAGDVPTIVQSAKDQYTDMVAMVEANSNQVFGTNKLMEDLGDLHKFFNAAKNDRAEGIIGRMMNILEGSPSASLADVIDFRGDINYLLSKTTRGKDYVKLNAIKDNIDAFVDQWATPKQKNQITKAIDDYANAKQLEEFDEIITAATDLDTGLVNWNKAKRDLDKAKLNTPDSKYAVDIVSKMAEKYGNEVRFRTAIAQKGIDPDTGNALGTFSYMVGKVKNTFALWGNRHDKLKMQKEILNAVNNSKTYNEFISKIEKMEGGKEVTEDVVKLIEYKPGARLTGDVDVTPLTATQKGTVSADASAGIMKERQDEIIQNFVKDIPNSEAVTKEADKLLESSRFKNVLSGVAKKLKADDEAYNVNMVTKIIKREADELIKRIEKAHGVKLPKQEADKLVKLRYEELMEGCK